MTTRVGEGEDAVAVTRDGVVESRHRAHVSIATDRGDGRTLMGEGDTAVYPRSSLKPFQAMAVKEILDGAGHTMTLEQTAMASASHTGSDAHQIEAASMLAEADLDESALQCPPAWPADDRVRQSLSAKTRLSHNCSGKHASMLWAAAALDCDTSTYLSTGSPVQRRMAERIVEAVGEPVRGPGIDGCGAPAWLCSLSGLATGFARLAAGADPSTAAVREAMTNRPVLVGGSGLPDTTLMQADGRVVAKRGADGVMACGFRSIELGAVGIAVKIVDGGDRAAGPLAAAVLHALGAIVPTDLLRVPVLGGGVEHGEIRALGLVTERVEQTVAAL